MIVYHGSTLEIKNPAISFSKNYLDFWKGFYLTTYKDQAENWAKRKAFRQNKNTLVSVFELSENFINCKVLSFDSENDKWLDFVCDCRKGSDIYTQYDIIIGSVADDDVFKTIDLYFEGIWTKEQALQELRYYKLNDQICLVNQEVLNTLLIFKDSYEVKQWLIIQQ